ncbi:MAG: beta strand repeat-containing protein, partial [Opitutaceae bacterium]
GYTETLGGTVQGTSGAANASGSFTGVAQGASSTAISVGLNGASAGQLTGTATLGFETEAINGSGLGTASVGSQTVNVTGTAYQLAQASVAPTDNPLNLGNARIGGTLSQNLTITNSAPDTSGYTETLGGTVQGTSGSATATGSISNVAAQASSTGIAVGLATSAAGAVSGSATLAFTSNAVNASGLGTTSLGTQTVNVQGAVYQAAQGSAGSPVNLGNFHVGDTASQALTVSNVAPNTSGYTENLGASVTGTSGAATASGSFTGVTQGGNSSAITVGLNTGTAGALSGTATLGYETEAINGSGLGTASVSSQTVSVTGAAYNLASASLGTIDFGKVLVGSSTAQYLSVTNTAPAGAYSEGLDATIAGFNGTSASLLSGSGSITNLSAGQTSLNDLSVSLNTSNAGTVSANVLVNLASDGATTSGLGITALPQQSAAVSGLIVEAEVGNLASASAAAPNPVNLGNVRIGATSPTQALTISNTATGPAEGLNASISTSAPGLTANGSFTSLQAGDTDSSSLVVGMNTATAGNKSGTATIALASDGSYNSGVTTDLGSQSISVTGAVYHVAQGSTASPVNLGNFHVGDTASQALTVSNVAPDTGGYTETLGGSVTGTGGAATASGSFTGLAQGASSTAISVGLNTSSAGALAGTATVGYETEAINGSGLGTASVGSQTVNVTGAAYQLAQAGVAPTDNPINLGNVRIGGTLSQNLTITNSAPDTSGYTETLGGTVQGTSGSATATGSISDVAAQGSSTGIAVGLATSAAGAVSGSATLAFTSNEVNGSGLGTTSLGAQTVNVQGAVYQAAEASALPPAVNLGTLRVGTTVNTGLAVTNSAPSTGGYTENLGAVFGTVDSGLSGSGSITGLAQGDSSNALGVKFTAGSAGAYSGSASVDFETEAINGSGLGDAAIGSQTVAFSATVDALAKAAIDLDPGAYSFASTGADSGTLNLGTVTSGSGVLDADLDIFNDVTGPADELLGAFDTTGLDGTPFSFAGDASYDLAAGQQSDFQIDFNTDAATGFFSETLVMNNASHNDDQTDLSLGSYDLTIEGTFAAAGTGGSVPDTASSLLLLAASLAALALARRRFSLA